MSDNRLTSPPANQAVLEGGNFSPAWWRLVSRVTAILGGREPLRLSEYAVASLPDAAKFKRCQILVTDETGGEVPAFSDGTNWRRVTDRAVVS